MFIIDYNSFLRWLIWNTIVNFATSIDITTKFIQINGLNQRKVEINKIKEMYIARNNKEKNMRPNG